LDQARLGRAAKALAAALLASVALSAEPPRAAAEPQLYHLAQAYYPNALTAGPDGNIWIAESYGISSEGAIGRVTPGGEITEFRLPAGHVAGGIVAGPDGALWFGGSGAIGKATTDGAITELPLPDARTRVSDIAVGADGNLWFTEPMADRIGRISPAGVVAEFPLAPERYPSGIAMGPDGAIWFTEFEGDRIGRITTTGKVSEFRLAKGRRPSAIVAGPDGNLWFTQSGASRIGRITPTGELADFTVPMEGPAYAIAAGGDGKIWFASGGSIGSISTDGSPGQLICVSDDCRLPAISLAAGAEGRLWFGASFEAPLYAGGGTGLTLPFYEHGKVGWLQPPAASVAIAAGERRVRGNRATVELTCVAATDCAGGLRLVQTLRPRPGSPHRTASPGGLRAVASGHYEIPAGQSAPVTVTLTAAARERLSHRGSLAVWTLAGVRAHTEAIQRLRLRGAGSADR
jgi:streptogramin lyase